jgi:hypothetical protein
MTDFVENSNDTFVTTATPETKSSSDFVLNFKQSSSTTTGGSKLKKKKKLTTDQIVAIVVLVVVLVGVGLMIMAFLGVFNEGNGPGVSLTPSLTPPTNLQVTVTIA